MNPHDTSIDAVQNPIVQGLGLLGFGVADWVSGFRVQRDLFVLDGLGFWVYASDEMGTWYLSVDRHNMLTACCLCVFFVPVRLLKFEHFPPRTLP